MPILEILSLRLHYEFDAASSRPALVLSNSLGANLSLWSRQMEELSQHFAVLHYDTRGQGQSSTPPGPYTIADMGTDLLGLLNALNLKRVHFCGISMGGMVGQWLAIHAAERIDKLVLSNTAAKIGTPERWNSRIDAVQREGMSSIATAVLSGWLTEPFRQEHPDILHWMEDTLITNDPAGYTACCAAVRDADFTQQLNRIAAPTLVICGSHDASTPPAQARSLADGIARSKLLELPAAHISNVEASQLFTAAVRDFLLEG